MVFNTACPYCIAEGHSKVCPFTIQQFSIPVHYYYFLLIGLLTKNSFRASALHFAGMPASTAILSLIDSHIIYQHLLRPYGCIYAHFASPVSANRNVEHQMKIKIKRPGIMPFISVGKGMIDMIIKEKFNLFFIPLHAIGMK